VQTRSFSAPSARRKPANGAAQPLIAPDVPSVAVSKPPDVQDRSNSKYPQVVQPQNSCEACVYGDGAGADSALEGVSEEQAGNQAGMAPPLQHRLLLVILGGCTRVLYVWIWSAVFCLPTHNSSTP
jgi:hypothetical protein